MIKRINYDTKKTKNFIRLFIALFASFLLLFIIFYNSILSPFILLDFEYFNITPFSIFLKFSFSLSNILQSLFSLFNLSHVFLQIILLIAIVVAYFYIRRQTKNIYFSFFIFVFNPFFYSRIMVGQLGVLLAYLLLPVFTYYLLKLEDNLKSILKLTIPFAIISSLQPHFAVICLIMATIWLLLKNKTDFKPTIKSITLLTIIMLFLNIYWLQGFFATSDTVFGSINYQHAEFFSPKLTQGVPTIMKIIGMWGFWREGAYITTYNTLPLPLWYALTLMFPLLMIIGYFSNKNKKTKFFFILWWVGLILAAGISHPYTRPLFDFLFRHVPFFSGFRDSHKFVALIVLSYTYLCPKGTNNFKKSLIYSFKNKRLVMLKKKLNYDLIKR